MGLKKISQQLGENLTVDELKEIIFYCKEKNEDEEEDGSDEDEALGRQDDDDSKHDTHAKKHSLGRVSLPFPGTID